MPHSGAGGSRHITPQTRIGTEECHVESYRPVVVPGTNPMVFIDRLKGTNHVVTTEIPHTVFLVFENDDISRMVFHSADPPGAMDRAIRSLVPQKVNGRRIVAVVTFAES